MLDFLSETRLRLIRELSQQAMKAITTNFGKYGSQNQYRFTHAKFCKASQAKYGTFMSWFVVKGIDMCDIQSYQGSWLKAAKSIQDIATTLSISGDSDAGLQGENWSKQCRMANCYYCSSKIKPRLGRVVSEAAENLPGVCLGCFLVDSSDCLRDNFCTKPGHSSEGSRIHWKSG